MNMQLSLIKQMEKFALEDSSVISLAQGTPFQQTDSHIREQVTKALQNDLVDKYSDPAGIKDLRLKISDDLKNDGMEYHEDEIIVTAGGIEALAVCMLSLLQRGDEIIFPVPCYAAYFKLAQLAGVTVIPVPLDEKNGWSLSSDSIKKIMTPKTKAILLCSPNNPTGSIYPKKVVKEICMLAQEKDCLIFQDDIYGNMFYTEPPFNPLVDTENKKQIIRIVSFSKDFALTGWRVGYIHTDRSYISDILSAHDTLVNCAPVISQYAALSALDVKERIITNSQKTYQYHRKLMGEALEELSEYLSFTWPDGSYFFFPKILGVENTEKFCLDMVRSVGLAVSPGEAFGKEGAGHIRLCFGKSEYEIIEGMKRLKTFLKTYEK